jgi:uncharacterized phage protein (TIGR01671 family)
MKREIKFRIWNPDSKKMYYVPEDGFLHIGESSFLNNPAWYFSKKDVNTFESCAYSDRSTIMQYTCLKDKNGKEIYEGDIINLPVLSEVVFMDGAFILKAEAFQNGALVNDIFKMYPFEIIGNIYENPELLTL